MRLVTHMADMQARPPPWIAWMSLASSGSAHLASIAVPVEHPGADLLRNISFKSRLRVGLIQNVLARLQSAQVIMCKDFETFLIAQLPHATCPFGNTARDLTQLIGVDHPANILQEVSAQL